MNADPLRTYQRHLARLNRHLAQMDIRNRQLSWWRLGLFFTGILATSLAYFLGPWPGRLTGSISLITFTFAVYLHRRLDRVHLHFRTTCQITATQIARAQLNWAQIPLVREHPDNGYSQNSKPLAQDLNLTGERSLLHLLNTTFSRGGVNRLRSWLLTPAHEPDPAQIQARHTLLHELIPRTGFRTRLTRSSALVTQPGQTWDGEGLLQWLEKHTKRPSTGTLLLLFLLAFANLTLFLLNTAGLLPPYWIGTTTLYFILYIAQTRTDTFNEALSLVQSLTQFHAVFTILENTPFPPASQLARLCTPFTTGDEPSRLIRRVTWIASAASLQRNPFLWLPLNVLIPWDRLFTHLLNRQKEHLRTRLPQWLDAWYELEALNALANFAHLNPDTTFPEILPISSTDILDARALGHPLIPRDVRVCNDFTLSNLGELAIITGSNMSGKSTFLRTLGVNLVLAYAGGPVLAKSLRLIPMRLCTSIQVSDSLSDGISYFYAEVKRLKTLLEALRADNPIPLFFLIDEIFRGTNNQERRIGSDAYLHALAGGNGTGLISTHDLELTQLADEISGVLNYHFREDIADGRMVFDYHLRPGPCPTTNALRIMALEGLPVNFKTDIP